MEKEIKDRFTTVSIPKPLADKTKKMIENTGFTSLSSFVEYVLREIVSEERGKKYARIERLEGVENKLRRLGYM